MDCSTLDHTATDTAAPVGLQRRAKPLARFVHQLTGLGLLRDLKQKRADLKPPAFVRCNHPLDEKIGPPRDPGQFLTEFRACVLPPLPEQDSDLAAGLNAAKIPFNALRRGDARFLKGDQGSQSPGNPCDSKQLSHYFYSPEGAI